MLMLGKALLTLFRDVFRNTRLGFFATEGTRLRYEAEIESILQTGWLLRVMEALRIKVYNFPDYGPDFVSILNLTYLNTFKYSIEEIEETTCLSRATIYRHKKRAIIMFGLAFDSIGGACRRRSIISSLRRSRIMITEMITLWSDVAEPPFFQWVQRLASSSSPMSSARDDC